MQKIIFCEKNKNLLKKVKKLFNEKDLTNNTHCELIIGGDDVFNAKKKYKNALIVTASNPNFSMGGGLDGLIKEKYPEQCKNAREFKFTGDLFFTITVDENLKSDKKIIQRALLGCYFASRKNDIIITGLGTGIGGLSDDDFILEFIKFINADFRSANFRSANFYSVNFNYADFRSANFNYADFRSANFRSANFYYANFRSANFYYTNFRFANFSSANFRSANFSYINFSSANFSYINFSSANFSYINFSSANFSYINFSSADFKNSIFNYKITPEEGKFIGWKKAKNKIIKLEIQNAKNVSGGLVGRKLRTNRVKVLEIQDIEGKKLKDKKTTSDHDEKFIYEVGKITEEKDYVHTDLIECEKGIHFFVTRDEAVIY